MQSQAPTLLPPPSTPRAPTASGSLVVPVSQIPQTRAEARAVRDKISDLKTQLQDFAERRQTVAGNLRNADPGARPGYIARLDNLDKSINVLQDQITQLNLALSQAPLSVIASSQQPPVDPNLFIDRAGRDLVPIVAILSVFVLSPIAITISRMLWKRTSNQPRVASVDPNTVQRIDQLQQSVDAIAIEVERISEGQRFVTRLLNEKDRALSAGAAEPVAQPERERVAKKR